MTDGSKAVGEADHHLLSTPDAKLCAAAMTLCLSASVADCSGMAASAAASHG